MNQTIDASVAKKYALLEKSALRYLIRAIFAGISLTMATGISVSVADYLGGTAILGKLAYSFSFPVGLIIIVFMNQELTTSNMMYTTNAVVRNQLKIGQAAKMILVCCVGNLIGSLLMGWLMSFTMPFNGLTDSHYLITATITKLNKSIPTLLIDGMIANMLVNTAIIGSLRSKNETAKLLFIYLVMFYFSFYGYEHVIANFGLFALAGFSTGINLTISAVLTNWIFAFIGNFIGGFVMGAGYGYLNKVDTGYLD